MEKSKKKKIRYYHFQNEDGKFEKFNLPLYYNQSLHRCLVLDLIPPDQKDPVQRMKNLQNEFFFKNYYSIVVEQIN